MNRLKDLREDRDLSQQEVADVLGISRQYYHCYESGKNEIPLRHCITLAKFYNVSLDYLSGILPTPISLQSGRSLRNPESKSERIARKYMSADEKSKKLIDIILDDYN